MSLNPRHSNQIKKSTCTACTHAHTQLYDNPHNHHSSDGTSERNEKWSSVGIDVEGSKLSLTAFWLSEATFRAGIPMLIMSKPRRFGGKSRTGPRGWLFFGELLFLRLPLSRPPCFIPGAKPALWPGHLPPKTWVSQPCTSMLEN